jgi:alpha-galactosidase/6-phospho-beta-glucosidase family protein
MAKTHTRLDKMEAFVNRMIKDNGVNASFVATTDQRASLLSGSRFRVRRPSSLS